MNYKKDYLSKLADICLRIANYVDREGEKGNTDMCNELGLGYLALSGYLRSGVKAIAEIQGSYSRERDLRDIADCSERYVRDFLEDIFGDREIDDINVDDKEKIREFVQKLEESWD